MISLGKSTPEERLRTYLNDHLSGAVAGAALAKRIRDRNSGPIGQTFTELVPDIERDEATLREIVAALGFSGASPKQMLADVVEKVGRLKLNGQIFGYSLLSQMEELEAMTLGIEGKYKLWKALGQIVDQRPEIARFDFERLAAQARLQHDRVERLRIDAAAEALSGGSGAQGSSTEVEEPLGAS